MATNVRQLQQSSFYFYLGIVFIIQCLVMLGLDGTCDSGDSIQHYLIAHYAFDHQELFFDHWGKPFFTLLASLPASVGFWGIKAFNIALTLWTAASIFHISQRLFSRWIWVASVVVFFMPEVFRLQYSGLTEPLFAAWLAASVLWAVKGKHKVAMVFASFLPFIRTEGFLLLPIFALFYLETWWTARKYSQGEGEKKESSLLNLIWVCALLTVGTVAYSLIGGIAKGGDITWVFTENPYEHLDNYGQGTWDHYPKKFIFITGVPTYGLWIMGLLVGLVGLTRPLWSGGKIGAAVKRLYPKLERMESESDRVKRMVADHSIAWRLIYLLFFTYFGAHVVFWATGTAHSMGLMRVLVAVAPMAALIAVRGITVILGMFNRPKVQNVLIGLIVAYVVVFPFLPNPASLKLHEFMLSPDQKILQENAHMNKYWRHGERIRYAHPYVPIAMDFDPFKYPRYMHNIGQQDLADGTLIIWDNWFSVIEAGVPETFFDEHPDKYTEINDELDFGPDGNEIKIKYFVVNNPSKPYFD